MITQRDIEAMKKEIVTDERGYFYEYRIELTGGEELFIKTETEIKSQEEVIRLFNEKYS